MATEIYYITLNYSGRSKSNFKDHYGDATKGQCLGIIAEINVFSFWRNVVSDGADWTSAGRLFQSRGPAAAKVRSPTVTSRDGPGGHRGDWRSTIAAGLNVSLADQRRTTAAGPTSTEVKCREKLGRQ